MSVFPGSLDSDATLYVAKDYISTTLSAPQAITDTVAVVASGTGWAANMVLSVDVGNLNVEQQLVTNVAGNILTVTRGFAGTSASAHAQNAVVSNNVDAIYQSALKAAIVAIETALGANLSNVPVSPLIASTNFNFSPRTPGGSLNIGANTITMNPMPPGITAASITAGAQLLITGGMGTQEAVPIIGWSSTSVTVTCANTHSGAWTIGSASSGIQEAIIFAGEGGSVYIPAGTWPVYGTIASISDCSIWGAGPRSTTLNFNHPTADVFHLSGGSAQVWSAGHFAIIPGVTQTGTGSVFVVDNHAFGQYEDIYIQQGFWNGFVVQASTFPRFTGIDIQGIINSGFSFPSGYQHQFQLTDVNISSNVGSGQTNNLIAIAGTVAGSIMQGVTLQGGLNCIHIDNTGGAINELRFSNLDFDSWHGYGLLAVGTGTSFNWSINLVRAGAETSNVGGAAIAIIGTGYENINIGNITGSANGASSQIGVQLDGVNNVNVDNVRWLGNGVNAAYDTILFIDGNTGPVSHLIASNLGGDGMQYPMVLQAYAHTDILICDSDFSGAASAAANTTTGSGPVAFRNVIGVDVAFTTPTIAAIASSTITLPSLPYPIAIVSADGSGGVATLTAPNGIQAVGYAVRIVATHANGIVFNTSGNIRSGKTLTTGQSAVLAWDGAKWNN